MAENVERIVSPKGIARYPFLTNPDTRMNPEGRFKVALELDTKISENKAFVAGLHKETAGKYPNGSPPYKKKENDESIVLVNFGSSYKPKVFDHLKKELPEEIIVGSGSEIKISFVKNFYKVANKTGMNLYLQAVQVLELVEYKGMSADDYGFESEGEPEETTTDGTDEEIPF